MTGVQLIGKKAVLARFENLDTETWALYQGKQFIVGGKGSDSLETWLQEFEQSGTTATYTLRAYDTDQVPTSSTGSMDYLACLSFKINDAYEGMGIAGHNTGLMARIKGLEEKIDKKPDDDEGEDLNSIIMGWLENPEKLGMVVGAVKQLFSSGAPQLLAAPVQTISGFDPTGGTTSEQQDSLTRLSKAIDILEKCDPLLVVHLEKLAKLAQSEPLIFKAIISKLDAL